MLLVLWSEVVVVLLRVNYSCPSLELLDPEVEGIMNCLDLHTELQGHIP